MTTNHIPNTWLHQFKRSPLIIQNSEGIWGELVWSCLALPSGNRDLSLAKTFHCRRTLLDLNFYTLRTNKSASRSLCYLIEKWSSSLCFAFFKWSKQPICWNTGFLFAFFFFLFFSSQQRSPKKKDPSFLICLLPARMIETNKLEQQFGFSRSSFPLGDHEFCCSNESCFFWFII